MAFEKGRQKTGGRTKGTPNRADNDLRKFLDNFLTGNKSDVNKAWEKLSPIQKLTVFKDLLRFVLPTMQSVSVQSDLERLDDDQLEYLLMELKAEMRKNLKNNERGKK